VKPIHLRALLWPGGRPMDRPPNREAQRLRATVGALPFGARGYHGPVGTDCGAMTWRG
jgi:hypothetical protein